jgi:hypothetical protein
MKKDKSAPAKKAVKKKAPVKKAAKKKAATTSKPAKASAPRKAKRPAAASPVSDRERYEMIATMAYYRAEKRDFAPGQDQQDWYECERIVDEMLGRVK